MRRFSVMVIFVVLVMALAGSGTAWAQGFGVYEQGACAMGRGGAGVAAPCPDGSSVFFNPAGLSFDSTQFSLGGVLIGPRGKFTNSSTQVISKLNDHWYPAPNIYYSRPMAKRLAIGMGVYAPYGLTTDWPTTSEGRFLGYKSLVQAIYVQPTMAIKLNEKLSIGAGIDITYMNVQLKQRVDLSTQLLPSATGIPAGSTFALIGVKPGSDFADVNLKGNTYHAGFHLGVLVQPTKRVSFGARYLSGQEVNIKDGSITTAQISTTYVLPIAIPGVAPAGTPLDTLLKTKFAAGQSLSNQKASTRMPLPGQVVVGTAFQATSRVKFMVDYQFTHWSMFDQLPINGEFLQSVVIESYKDTHGVRAGTEINLGMKSVLRGGLDIHTAAAPPQTVTPNLPEGWRQEYTLGFGHQMWEKLRFDIGYMRLRQPDRAGRTTNGGKLYPTVADNNGTYSFRANLIGMALSMKF